MESVRQRGTTVVLVSHDLVTVARMCDRACLLVRGCLDVEGEPGKVIARYRKVLAAAPGDLRTIPRAVSGPQTLGIGERSPEPDGRPLGRS